MKRGLLVSGGGSSREAALSGDSSPLETHNTYCFGWEQGGVNEETLSKVTASFCNLKKKKHPLSVTADLVSVNLALRLPGKHK